MSCWRSGLIVVEGTCLVIELNGKEVPAGQIYDGRLVFWSTQDTYMRKYDSPRGMEAEVLDAVQKAGITELDLIQPSRSYRANISDFFDSDKTYFVIERGRVQRFLRMDHWTTIKRYRPPFVDRLEKVKIEVL